MKHVLVYGMTDNPGGIETYLHNFFHRVHGKTVMLDFVSDFPTISGADKLTERGAKLHFIPAKSKDLKGHLLGIWNILRQHREYETVYFNILDAGAVVTMLPAFLLGRKIVAHSHNGSTNKKLLHSLCKPFLNILTQERISCSPASATYMFGSKDYIFIPNAIDAAAYRFNPSVRQEKRNELNLGQRPVICHVGRLSYQKNPLGLLDIVAAVHGQCPDIVLLSVGTGEMADEFYEGIIQRKLENVVKCLGARNDVAEILQAADVFVLPSIYEGLPISLLEAQAAGVQCVASDVICREAAATDLVHFVNVNERPQVWADVILNGLNKVHEDTFAQIAVAGFDISNCEEHDRKLIDAFSKN